MRASDEGMRLPTSSRTSVASSTIFLPVQIPSDAIPRLAMSAILVLSLLANVAILAAGLWFYFGRKRFVGTPRLSELPKAVGLGIYQVGTAPIRVVADGIGSTIRLVAGNSGEPEEDEG